MRVVKLSTWEEPLGEATYCRMDWGIGDTDTADHHP